MNTEAARADFVQRLTRALTQTDDLGKFLRALAQIFTRVFRLKWASLYLFDRETGQYNLRATFSNNAEVGTRQLKPPLVGTASWINQRQQVLTQRLMDEIGPQMAPELKAELSRQDIFLSIPLFVGEQLIGVLNLGNQTQRRPCSKEDLQLLSELAQLLAVLVKQAVDQHLLLEQKVRQQSVIDNLVSGIIAIDPDDKISLFNHSAARILNLRASEALGKDIRILPANLANLLLATLHQGQSCRRQEVYVSLENILIGVSSAQFHNAQGRLLGAYMVFSDLVEVKKKQRAERQQRLNSYWSNVANSLAHEVKNSIMATKVYTELFPQQYEDAEFRWSLYSALKRDMAKLDNFTERVLNFAQPQPLLTQSCRIEQIVDAAMNAALADRDNLAGIKVEKKYGPELPLFSGDYHQLKETFAQIISNALEALGPQGRLSVNIAKEQDPHALIYELPEAVSEMPAGKMIVVKISDNGCGIAPENLPQVFDPFFTTKAGKTGLGLAFARKAVQRHKGIIRVESRPEQGATFWVCLPVLSAAQ